MRIFSRWLLLLLSLLYTSTILAQDYIYVEIHGVSSEFEQNIRLFLSIEQQREKSGMNEARVRLLHKKASKQIERAIQPYGYYQPTIESKLSKGLTESGAEQWLAVYTVNVGRAVIIDEYDFKINDAMELDPEFQKIIKKHSLYSGEVFNHVKYDKFKNDLALLAAERGYFNAKFTKHQVEIDLESFTADIKLHYEGGKRYRFGDVYLKQDVLNPDFLQRYIPFKKGDDYTFSAMLELQQALSDSDYFRTVEVSPGEVLQDKDDISVTVLLTPRKRNRYNVGVGYGTDTRARAKFGWEIPQLNKLGHRIKTEAKISELGYSFSAQYKVPVLNPRTDQLIYSTSIVNEQTVTSENTVRTIGVSLSYSRDKWREAIALNYQEEVFFIANQHDRSRSLIPGVSWIRIWGDDFINIFDGLRFDFSLRGASEEWFSDTNFVQAQGSLKGINPIGENNRLIAYGKLGSTWVDDFNDLPKSLRFFTGGSTSVRGYAYESLGPVNEGGEVVGGQYLMVGSLEFEHSFTKKWAAAIFIDAGNAINDLDDKLARGAGFGVRWRSPIGPVRLDLANALSRDDRPWRLHITIGPDL